MGECILQTGGGGGGFPAGWNEKAEGIAWDDIKKNDPIVLREYGKIEDGLQEFQRLNSGEVANGFGCSFSPDSRYLAVTNYNENLVIVYKFAENSFSELQRITVLSQPYYCGFIEDGAMLIVCCNSRHPPIAPYKHEGDSFTLMQELYTMPNWSVSSFCFDYNLESKLLLVVFMFDPFVRVFLYDGTKFIDKGVPLSPMFGGACVVKFSPDGKFLVVAFLEAPFLAIYSHGSPYGFYKIANPPILPTTRVFDLEFSPDGIYLAVAVFNAGASMLMYKRNGDVFTKLPDQFGTVDHVFCCKFSSDGNYFAFGTNTNGIDSFHIYKINEGTFVKLPNPFPSLNGSVTSIEFSFDDKFVATVKARTPSIVTYLNEQKTYVNPLNKVNSDYFRYAPTGKIGIATESSPKDSPIKATLFPALYNLTENGQGVT